MWDRFISFINALIIHALLLAVLFFTIEPLKAPKPAPKPEQFMQAVTVDENQWLAAIQNREHSAKRASQALRAQQRDLDIKKRKLEKKVTQETQHLDKLRRQKEQEQQRLAKLKQRQLLEAAALEELKHQQAEQARLKQEALERIAKAREKKAKRKAEQARLAAEKKKKAEEKARLAKKAEKKRQAEEKARLARKAEKKRKAKAQEKARLAKEAEKKRKEQARLAEAQRKAEQDALIQKVMGDIQYQVREQWTRPSGYYRGLSCVIEIRLKPGGVVKQVNIMNSSGNPIFDNSAKLAVRKASPLPVPNKVFDIFRHFSLTFKPKY